MSSSIPTTTTATPLVVVLGCGVIGLTTALALQRALGSSVRILIRTKSTPLQATTDAHYTSARAGAHWFSFAREDEVSKQAQDELAFQALSGLAVMEPNSGCATVRGHALFETHEAAVLPWWRTIVPRFREWTPEELRAKTAETGVEYVRAFSYESIMIHVEQYLLFLYNQFIAAGGEVQLDAVEHLSDLWLGLPPASQPDVIINCCGLGSATLGGVEDSTCVPDRGQTIRVLAEGITDIWRSPGEQATYILPRGDGTVILGGTHDTSRADLLHDPQVTKSILERCSRLLPLLRDPSNYTILNHSVGLRPARAASQRVEVDERWSTPRTCESSSSSSTSGDKERLVVHAYGHGGDGFQASWGTATVVVHLVQQARPHLFAQRPTFHQRHSQLRTDVLKRAGITHQP